jgi:DNA-binding MarR family transcriptional regulator
MKCENEIIESTPLIKMFLIVDKLQQRLLSTSSKKQVALVESLTKRQEKSLFVVFQLSHQKPGGITLTELAERLNMTTSATSVLVESMVQKDLLSRVPCSADRRAVRIRLSDQGQEIYENCCQQIEHSMKHLVDGLSEEEKVYFERITQHFYDLLFTEK